MINIITNILNMNISPVAIVLLYLFFQRIELSHIVSDGALHMGSITVSHESVQWYGQ